MVTNDTDNVPENERTVQTGFRLPLSLMRRLRIAAAERGTTPGKLAQAAIEKYLKTLGQRKG